MAARAGRETRRPLGSQCMECGGRVKRRDCFGFLRSGLVFSAGVMKTSPMKHPKRCGAGASHRSPWEWLFIGGSCAGQRGRQRSREEKPPAEEGSYGGPSRIPPKQGRASPHPVGLIRRGRPKLPPNGGAGELCLESWRRVQCAGGVVWLMRYRFPPQSMAGTMKHPKRCGAGASHCSPWGRQCIGGSCAG